MVRIPHDEPTPSGATATGDANGSDLVSAGVQPEDGEPSVALRPRRFDEYIGQTQLVDKLRIYVDAAQQRGDALDHVLFHGPPGLGKTTLAQILATELDVQLHVTSGPAIEHKGVLAAQLTGLGKGDLLFIDEIHRLPATVEESLYSAMEDRRIDLPVGDGSRARTMSFQLPGFTLVGATTRTALLTAPLRDRFHIVEALAFYTDAELSNIVARAASLLGVKTTAEGALEVGRRSRGTPRIAIRLTRRIRDFVQVGGYSSIDASVADEFLGRLGVDRHGLDGMDRRLLEAIATLFDGGPVGIDALAASLGEPRDTLEDVHEPFLLQRGFLIRSPRGRMITERARRHLDESGAS
ncbi:MAG: Holliday junction branch migration DNA helicase RuvB [Myxococcales bacterium FL481]|nr:MAG: Holliday junction branch migration DNA helicase RuvB [Myxococcales bacterium FL481]